MSEQFVLSLSPFSANGGGDAGIEGTQRGCARRDRQTQISSTNGSRAPVIRK
jgi:hypothetical protein